MALYPWQVAVLVVLIALFIGLIIFGVVSVCRQRSERVRLFDQLIGRVRGTVPKRVAPVEAWEAALTEGNSENESRIGVVDDDDADLPLFIIDGVAYRTGLAAPPPLYDEALTMRKPTEGEVVRFTVGNGIDDGILFEFVMPSSELVSVKIESAEAAVATGSNDTSGTAANYYRYQYLPPPIYCGRVARITRNFDSVDAGLLPLSAEIDLIDETVLSTIAPDAAIVSELF